MKKKMNTNKPFFRKESFTGKLVKDKRAVSPVIGVILMVAVTVILSAVIAAFVFGMGGHLTPTLDLHFSSVDAHVATNGYLTMTAIGADKIAIATAGTPTTSEIITVVEKNGASVSISSLASAPAADASVHAGTRLTVTTGAAFVAGDNIRVILTDPGTGTLLVDIEVIARTYA